MVASTELQPCAMLANGPPWMKAGLFSSVCTRFGFSASLSSTVIAPWALRSRARIGVRSRAVADDDVAEPLLEVDEAVGQAENRHDLGGHHDVEAVLPREAVAGTAQAPP